MAVGIAALLLLIAGDALPPGQGRIAFQSETATDGEQAMMQVFPIRLPAGRVAIRLAKFPLHIDKIVVTQSFEPTRQRLFHHGDGRLAHLLTHHLRQMIRPDSLPFIFQNPKGVSMVMPG